MFGTIISGIVCGALAKWLMKSQYQGNLGCFLTMLLGIGGSFVANKIGSLLGWYKEDDAAGWIMSTAGAVLILFESAS